jgi:uncharacterized protein YqhQ
MALLNKLILLIINFFAKSIQGITRINFIDDKYDDEEVNNEQNNKEDEEKEEEKEKGEDDDLYDDDSLVLDYGEEKNRYM